MAEVYIGLGSNIDHPVEQLRRAFRALDRLPSTRLIDRSMLYQSRPVGPPNQPDYVNAVAVLRTVLAPMILLRHLHAIERRQKRVRSRAWGPRTLDLDVLLYGHMTYRHPRLVIPHPRLHQRTFVLAPLCEIDPDLIIPGKGKVKSLLAGLKQSAHQKAVEPV